MTMNQKLSAARDARMPTLADAMLANIMAPSTATSALTKAALIVFGSLLLAVSAQFKIPLYPVPVTGQTLVVLLIGMTYGPRLGGITMAAYLFEGALLKTFRNFAEIAFFAKLHVKTQHLTHFQP